MSQLQFKIQGSGIGIKRPDLLLLKLALTGVQAA